MYMNTKLITLGSVNWWFMKGFWRSISLLNLYTNICMCVHGEWLLFCCCYLASTFFTLAFWLFLKISELGNDTHIILLHVKAIRYPRCGEFDNRLHMNTCAHFKDVNHSLGELPLWKLSDFLQEFVHVVRSDYQCLLTPVSPTNTLMCQVKILAWWTRRHHGDFLALFPAKLAGCAIAGAQQSC